MERGRKREREREREIERERETRQADRYEEGGFVLLNHAQKDGNILFSCDNFNFFFSSVL